MFKQTLLSRARKNRALIEYKPSCKRTIRNKNSIKPILLFKFILCIVIFTVSALYALPLYATTYNSYSTLDDVSTGQLLLETSETIKANHKESHLYQPAILLNSAASFDINGIIALVTVTQSFINTGEEIANGLYTFPLPENSAVNYLKIQVGDREIEGKILEKNRAKKLFDHAKNSGKRASLIEQYRPNLFTNKISNIAPHEQITVTLKYVQHIDYKDNQFSLRFPMDITPRYQAKHELIEAWQQSALEKEHNLIFSKSLLEDKKITPPSQSPQLNKNTINLKVNLNAGFKLQKITSPSHAITLSSNKHAGKPINIKEGNVQVPMDRDFILQWQAETKPTPQLSLFNQTIDGEEYTLAMLLPQSRQESNNIAAQDAFARDITFIIDTSGSMQGESIKQAKESLVFALKTLKSKDSFNIIAFASQSVSLFPTTHMATPKNIEIALDFIHQLSADGGTEMYLPLAKALSMEQSNKQFDHAIKQILFITDGAVSNELSLFELIKNTHVLPRLFTVGIGRAPNSYFMRKAAQYGQGSYTYIADVNEVEKKMSILLKKISQPVLTNIQVQFHPLHLGNIEQYPKKIPDLYSNEPIIIAFKTSKKPNSIQFFGDLSNQGWQQEIELSNVKVQAHSSGISSIWARAKIEDLLDGLVAGNNLDVVKEKVIKTSLKHQVMSPYTSLIAIEEVNRSDSTLANQSTQLNRDLHAVVFPKTALGWKSHCLLGLLLLLSAVILFQATTKNHQG